MKKSISLYANDLARHRALKAKQKKEAHRKAVQRKRIEDKAIKG